MATLTKRKQAITNRIAPLRLAFGLTLVLSALVFLPTVSANPTVQWSVLGAAATLLVFNILLSRSVAKSGRRLFYEFLPKPMHYVQLTMHSSTFACGVIALQGRHPGCSRSFRQPSRSDARAATWRPLT